MAGGERCGLACCGLACPGEVLRDTVEPEWYQLGYEVRVRANLGLDIEIVEEHRRLTASLSVSEAATLFRIMLDKLDVQLLGHAEPSPAAFHIIHKLVERAAGWLQAEQRHRLTLEKRLRAAMEKARVYKEMKTRLAELEEKQRNCSGEECGKLREEAYELQRKLWDLEVCLDEDHCVDPPAAAKELARQLRDAEEREKRLRIAAIALAHAWRALTHPRIDDLEQLYSLGNSGKGPLMKHLENKAAEEAAWPA